VDALFRSAAREKGTGVVGVVLSGTRGDGTAGLAAVKSNGGATIVQDPEEALYAGMPATALAHVAVDIVVPSGQVSDTIVAMVNGQDPPAPDRGTPSEDSPAPSTIASGHSHSGEEDPSSGESASTVCPECGGVLTERREDGVPMWQCRVGHRYSSESLSDGQAEDVETALWAAIRVLEDRSRLLERMAAQFEASAHDRTVRSLRRQATSAREQALAVRNVLAAAAEGTLRKVGDDDELAQRRAM
jgi:two-component system chemotaxis response regulator CheB